MVPNEVGQILLYCCSETEGINCESVEGRDGFREQEKADATA